MPTVPLSLHKKEPEVEIENNEECPSEGSPSGCPMFWTPTRAQWDEFNKNMGEINGSLKHLVPRVERIERAVDKAQMQVQDSLTDRVKGYEAATADFRKIRKDTVQKVGIAFITAVFAVSGTLLVSGLSSCKAAPRSLPAVTPFLPPPK